MTRTTWFLTGWLSACLAISAGAFGLLWAYNAGSGRHLHHPPSTPRSVPNG